MSQPIGLDPGSEENPDPEEDSDWGQATGEGSLSDGPRHDDPEALLERAEAVEADSLDEVAASGPETSERQNAPAAEHPTLANSEQDEVCGIDFGQNSSSVAPEDERECGDTLEQDDSFEQDEQMAAPESENGVIQHACSESDHGAMQHACSESDQQLVGVQISGASSGEDRLALVESNQVEVICDNSEIHGGASVFHLQHENGAQNVAENCVTHQVFSGDVQVAVSSDIDAPEDDIIRPNVALVHETGRVSTSEESHVIESQRVNAISADRDPDSQVPECDRTEGAGPFLSNNRDSDMDVTEAPASVDHLESVDQTEGESQSPPLQDCISNAVVKNFEVEDNIGASPEANSGDKDGTVCNSLEPIPHSSTESSVMSCSSSSPSLVKGQSTHSIQSPSPNTTSIPNGTDMSESSINSSHAAPIMNPLSESKSCTNSSPKLPSPCNTEIPSTLSSSAAEGAPTSTRSESSLALSQPPNNTTSHLNSNHERKHLHNNPSHSDPPLQESSGHNPGLSQSSQILFRGKEKPVTSSDDDLQKQLALALLKDDDEDEELDDIMSQLDAELLSSSKGFSPQRSSSGQSLESRTKSNGLIDSDLKQLQNHNRQLLEQLKIRDAEIRKLSEEKESVITELAKARSDCDAALSRASSSQNADDLYLPQIKELENTIVQQQKEVQMAKEKLMSHDAAAKKAVTTLQNELKNRVDQVTKHYEDAVKEKDSMVVMFAASESKVMDAQRAVEKMETRLKDAVREKESLISSLKMANGEKQKAVKGLEHKCAEVGNLQKEMEKLKEALSSTDYRIKWFQNKLKEELETHKETKTNLEKTTQKLKEAKEETEIIRRECQAIVKTYQESEEIKSNSLDKELKMKESQFQLHMREWSDTEELHQKTRKELDSLKDQHKDAISQVSQMKEKIQQLETCLSEKDTTISQSNEMLNKQKADLADQASKIKQKENLDEDYNRAQEMIKTLDRDISELKVSNRDLQKDMDSCRERESKMLALQSELSKTNACLRSENTTLSNKATNLMAEVERQKMVIQELETNVRHLTDSLDEERKTGAQTVGKLNASLEEKTKESSDFKQKWEDEIDSNKILKRRHANNVKDLTRQLQQTKRKLESLEGSGKDSGGSMGSRTNSNGSLNSIDNSQAGSGGHHANSHSAAATPTVAPVQEFPVITEQVEIDKQVLIDRIVRLQKSHARKNEKLEFLGEHIQQLLEEIKKKTKIIQSYVMREEAGTLSSEDMDANKSLLSRKGGIMASMYSLHQQDGAMTLELSLQINKKLQAVLEDTLLKNITLKENLDTLGEEIARLSQFNRKLQLHLQELEKSKKT